MLCLGEISFLNALPLSCTLSTLSNTPLHIQDGTPRELNKAMQEGRLNVSPVSSAFYLRHQDDFVLMNDLSISAQSPVESVVLYLPQDTFIPNTPLYVPDTSETSIALLEYLLYRKTGQRVQASLTFYAPGEALHLIRQGHTVLAIGNEALLLRYALKDPVTHLDLAELWQQETDLPFVFAVWVASHEWVERNMTLFTRLNQHLIEQKQRFLTDPAWQDHILQKACQRAPELPPDVIHRYLTHAITYNLDTMHQEALLRFDTILKWLDEDGSTHRHRSRLPVQRLHG